MIVENLFKPKPTVVEGSAANDYFTRRNSEEERIAGTRAPVKNKKNPANTDYSKRRAQEKKVEQGVAEGLNDTIYPNATVIKSKNGRPVGEIYQDGNSWGCFHYRADRGYDFIDSREDAIQALKNLHQETGRSGPDYTIKGVTEAINPDITNPEFSHQQQIGDYLYVARYWSKGLKITAYHGNKQIGYAELMYQSAPFDDFADPKTTPKRIWLESEWTRVDPKYQRQGIMSTMYAYAKMLGNSVKPSQTRSDDAKAAWKSWRDAGDAQHLTREGVAEGLNEMDKTQTPPGRDGGIDWTKKQIHLGPEHVIKTKDVAKHALKVLNKTMKKSHADTAKKKDVVEAFGPLPREKQQIRLGRHTVDIERVGLDNNYISFAWHDSQGQEHYEEVPVGDLGSYDDLIDRIKDEIRYQERQYTDQGVAEGVNDYLWHGSKSEHEILYPQQASDTGGKEESNKNAVYATPSAKVAIAMGLTTPGSDTGMFPNDPQLVLFSGNIRKGQMVYLHKVPKNLFIKHNDREWYSKPGVKEVKPIETKAVPVDQWLHLIRQATPQDLELQKKYMKKAVKEVVHPDIFDKHILNEPTEKVRMGDFEFKARPFRGRIRGYGNLNDIGLYITAYDRQNVIGHAQFVVKSDEKGDQWLESAWTEVDQDYDGRGVAAMMYAFAKSLGNDIKPSPDQSTYGKWMWKKWGKDAKHLVGEQGVAEGSGDNDDIKRLKAGNSTSDGIDMQDIRLMAGEGKLTKKTVLQAIAVIRKQREQQGVAESDHQSSSKTGIYQTEVYGSKAYHSKCLEKGCDWESRRFDRIKQAQDAAKKHAQKHLKSNVKEDAAGDLGTIPTTEFVKGIYSLAAEYGAEAPDPEQVKKMMVLAPNREVDIQKTFQKIIATFQAQLPKITQMMSELDAIIKQADVQEGKSDLQEIQRTKGDEEGLSTKGQNWGKETLAKIKMLPGSQRFGYTAGDAGRAGSFLTGADTIIELFDVKHPQDGLRKAGFLSLRSAPWFPIKNSYQVANVGLDSEYRGQGLGQNLYGVAMKLLGMTIVADDTQTPQARSSWLRLSQVPGVAINGYTSVFPDEWALRNNRNEIYDDSAKRLISSLLKAGGQEIGKNPDFVYVSFPVGANADQNELQALQKGITIYSARHPEDGGTQNGLYARWGGQVNEQGDDPWGPQGNFAGDKPINVGDVTMKIIQVGDIVKYLGQRARVVGMSKNRKYSRISIESEFGGITKDVLTADLKQLGQGVKEGSKRKKKKTSRSLGRYFFPGYGYYGSGESGGGSGDGGGGESINRGVAEGFDKEAEAYKLHLLKTAPKVMDFLAKAVKGWRPSEEEMLGAIDTGYIVMKHTGDVKQAGKAMMDELNTLHRMSQGQQGVAEARMSAAQRLSMAWDKQRAKSDASLRRTPSSIPKSIPEPKKTDTEPKTVSESRAQRRALMAQMLNSR